MFVEVVRLLITLVLTAVGFLAGEALPDLWPDADMDGETAAVWGALLGAGVSYVIGGVLGRHFKRVVGDAPQMIPTRTAPELFVGAFGLLIGVIVGAVASVPVVALLPASIGWPLAGLIVVVASSFGWKLFGSRSGELVSWVGLSEPPATPDNTMAQGYLVDSSAAIDGRLVELFRSKLLAGAVLVPGFVIDEIQGLADADDIKIWRRGRRGLDYLDVLRALPKTTFEVLENTVPETADVDAKLIALALRDATSIITTDHNLATAAELRGVRVVNPHAIGESLRPIVAMGDAMSLAIERAGSEPGQGVGYLDDGTMVVVSDAESAVGEVLDVEVANLVTTAVGRLVFAKKV